MRPMVKDRIERLLNPAETMYENTDAGIGIFGRLFASKISYGLILFACYLGSANHDLIGRVEDYVLHHNVPVEEKSFSDPRGLSVQIETNSNGHREVYLEHRESGKRYRIENDLLPPTEEMLHGLESRLHTDDKDMIMKWMKGVK